MESACGNEKNVVGANHAVACVDGRAFDDRKNVSLNALARNIRPVARFAPGDFINFIDKDDAHLLGTLDGNARDLVHIQQLVFFLLDQVFESIGHGHLALFFLLAKQPREVGEHVLHIDVHVLDALVGNDLERRHRAFSNLEVDHPLIELAFAKLDAQFFSRAL